MENFLWDDLNLLFVILNGRDGGDRANESVGVPIDSRTAIRVGQTSAHTSNRLVAHSSFLDDLRRRTHRAGENQCQNRKSSKTSHAADVSTPSHAVQVTNTKTYFVGKLPQNRDNA